MGWVFVPMLQYWQYWMFLLSDDLPECCTQWGGEHFLVWLQTHEGPTPCWAGCSGCGQNIIRLYGKLAACGLHYRSREIPRCAFGRCLGHVVWPILWLAWTVGQTTQHSTWHSGLSKSYLSLPYVCPWNLDYTMHFNTYIWLSHTCVQFLYGSLSVMFLSLLKCTDGHQKGCAETKEKKLCEV